MSLDEFAASDHFHPEPCATVEVTEAALKSRMHPVRSFAKTEPQDDSYALHKHIPQSLESAIQADS